MPPKKKVVKVESTRADAAEPTWQPTPEGKRRALTLRLVAAGLWLVAIALEAFAIFWLLRVPVEELEAAGGFPTSRLIWLIVLIVVVGALALTGSSLWKRANRLDPASRKDAFRFFVQNQLGAIVTIIAFLPLIVVIFLNKDMDGRQKGIAGGIGIAVLLVAALLGADYNPPSVEEYDEQRAFVAQLQGVAPGDEEVTWVKGGSVFHLCDTVPDVSRESQDNQIYSGPISAAIDAGKSRLTMRWQSEASTCGFEVPAGIAVPGFLGGDGSTPEPTEEAPADDEESAAA